MRKFGMALLGLAALSSAAVVWQSTQGSQVKQADGTLGNYWYGYAYSAGTVTTNPTGWAATVNATTPVAAYLNLYSSMVVPSSGSSYNPYAGEGFGWIAPSASSTSYDMTASSPLCITYSSHNPIGASIKSATEYDFTLPATGTTTVDTTFTLDLTAAGVSTAAAASVGLGFQYQNTPGTSDTLNMFKIELGGCGTVATSSSGTSSSSAISSATSSSSTTSSTTVSSSAVVSNPNYLVLWNVAMSNQAKGVGSVPGADTTTLKAGYFYTQASIATVAPASNAPLIASITASNAIGIKVASWPATVPPYPSASLGLDFYNNGATATRATKKALDLTAFGGLCVTYYATDSIWLKVMQSDYVDTWGTDFYTALIGAGSKVYVPFSAMKNPSWASATQTPAKDFTKAVALGFAAQGNATFSMTELGLAKTASDCASMTASTSPTTVVTTVASSSSTKVSSSSAVTSVLTTALSNGFGFTLISASAVSFHTDSPRMVTLNVYNTAGTLVRSLYQGQANGDMSMQMGKALRPGVYIYRLVSGADIRTTTVVSR